MYSTMLVHALYIYKNSSNYPNTSLIKNRVDNLKNLQILCFYFKYSYFVIVFSAICESNKKKKISAS